MQNLICFLFMMMWIHNGVFSQECSLKVTYELIHNYCEGKNGADLILKVTGGFPPYNYSWNNGERSKAIKLSDNGIFQVKITDRKGCITEFSTEYRAISTLKIENIKHERQPDGNYRLIVDASGGAPPYKYHWFGPENQNVDTHVLTNALPGDYLLVVKDSKNCVLSRPHQIVAKED